jgi:HD-like signal output (HDOD) protein
MKELKYVEKIKKGDSLLSLPQSLSQIINMVGKEDFSMNDLADVILKDPGLTSRLLKMANSAFYRQRSQIATVHQAVMVLGVMQVKCLALSASVFKTETLQTKYHLDIKEMFGHFISVALGCKMLAAAGGQESTEDVFIAGLLHDIGLVFFVHHFPDDYKEVLAKLEEYPNLVEAERAILGIDHAAIGKMLAEKWSFPASLTEAIGSHHQLPEKVDKVTTAHIVQLSELMNKPIFDARPRNLEKRLGAISHMTKLLKIERLKIDEISLSLLNETIKTAEYMGIDIGDPAEVLSRANKELFNSYQLLENLFRERQDLSQRILTEERRAAAMELKNIAMATLSHYINNAAMAISGRAQLIKLLREKGNIQDPEGKLESILEIIEKSVRKIMAVLYELRDLASLEDIEKYSESKAINIDDRIAERMSQIERDSEIMAADSHRLTAR